MKARRMKAPRASWRAAMAMLLLAMLLSACGGSTTPAPAPPPAEVSDEATGHYCGMLLVDHPGPKGQVHLASRDTPLWFSSVRDTIAFLRLPEEARDVVAVYVNDMGKAHDWDQPEAGTWVDARAAWFVLDSAMRGGMGANEAVPFAVRADADSFRDRHGGRVVRLDDIPDDYVLGPVELAPLPTDAGSGMPTGHEHPTDAVGHPDH
jgi:copper chaperone NosL